MQRRLASWGIGQAVVCPLGVDLRTFNPAARTPDLRERLGLPQNSRVLVYAGRLAPEKNLSVLLEAFRVLGERYHLVLAGTGAALPEQRNVTHLPFIDSPRALARLIASADALVHAGDQETFGLILLEAMACGRGVVAAAAGAVPELVDEACGVLVAPRDPRALAAGIRAFYRTDCDARGARARARVERAYGWDAAMRGLLTVYRAAVTTAQRTQARYAAP
jgi:alpha-1,6-mannosyltransferase